MALPPTYFATDRIRQKSVGPRLPPLTPMGTVIAVPRTLNHMQNKKLTKYGFLLKIARARRKKSKEVAGTATTYINVTIINAK